MAEQIGLRAVFDLSQWNRGITDYTRSITNITKTTGDAGNSLGGQFIGMGQSVLKFGAIAGGVAIGGAAALAGGIVALGAAALGEVAKFERMTLSITNLVAREISGGQMIEQSRQARIQLTEKESKELEKLQQNMDNEANSREVLSARIQEQKERIRQLTEQYGENGLVVIKERAELQGMELDFNDLNSTISQHEARISELTGKEGQLTTVLEKVRVGQISMSEAMGQAAPRAQELIKWIQILAIQSPFNSEGIQMAFQTALAYGFTTEQAQRLTAAEVDFVAATGRTAQSADLIALALGQIQARGKLSAQELRQLSEQGVATNRILEEMGFSLDDVTNGLVDADAFIEAVIKDMEIFTGAAKAQATTFSGLTSSLDEIKDVGLREFFTGTFEAIRPYLADFVDFLTSAALETGSIRALGDVLGKNVAGAFQKISEFIATIRAGGLAVFSKYLGTEGIPLWYELKELVGNITSSLSDLGSMIDTNLSGPMSDFTSNIIPLLTQGLNFINEHFDEFKGALAGIGVVLGGAVFAALIAGLISLLTPINLIIVGAALLGAAWAGNWGGIRDTTMAAWAVIQPILQDVWTWLQINVPIAIQYLSDLWTGTLLPAFQQIGEFMSSTVVPALSELWTWLQTNLPVAVQALSDIWNNTLLPGFQTVADFVQGTLFPAWVELQAWFTENIPAAIETVTSFWSGTLLPALTSVWSYLNKNIFPLFSSINDLLSAVFSKTIEALAGLWQNVLFPALESVWGILSDSLQPVFESIAQVISENVSPVLSDLGEATLPLLSKGLETVTGWIQEATNFFKSLAKAVEDFKLPAVLTPGSPPPMAVALANIAESASLATGAMQSFTESMQSSMGMTGAQFNKTFVDALKSVFPALTAQGAKFEEMMSNIVKAAMPGIVQAFEAGTLSADDLKKQLLDLAGPTLGLTGEALAKFQSKIKRYINFDDLVTGIAEARQKVLSEATKMAADLASALGQFGQMVLGRWADPLERQIGLLQEFVDGQNEAGEAAANAADKIKKNTETIADNNLKLQELGLTREEQQIKIDEQVEKIAELTDRYGANSTEVRKAQLELERLKLKMVKINNEIADTQSSTTKLEDEIIQLQLAVSGTLDPDQLVKIGNLWIKASEAQDLLNAKLEEQKKLQEEQAKLAQQQADLAFLQSQLSLIDMIRNAGLDPAQIFEGITFGLTASLPDMIAATQQAVQALINQVNQGLQIASPSKVMAKAGRMTMAGLAQGITQSQAMVASSVAATRDMLQQAFVPQSLLAAGPSVQGGAVTNNTYYDFNMNVNTGASPQAVIRQYDVMRGMVGT